MPATARAARIAAGVATLGIALGLLALHDLWLCADEMVFYFVLFGAVWALPAIGLASLALVPTTLALRSAGARWPSPFVVVGVLGYGDALTDLGASVAGAIESPRPYLAGALRPQRFPTLGRIQWPVVTRATLPARGGFIVDGRGLSALGPFGAARAELVYVVDPTTGAYRGFRLPEPLRDDGGFAALRWSHERQALFAFHGQASVGGGALRIDSVARDGRSDQQVVGNPGSVDCAVLADGAHLACARATPSGEGVVELVVHLASMRGGEAPRRAQRQLAVADQAPLWAVSPDGREVAWAERGKTAAEDEVRVGSLLGDAHEAPRRVIGGVRDRRITAISWSPDGRRLAALRGGIIVVSRADGDGAREIALPPPRSGLEHDGVTSIAWSPDGTRLAAVADLDTGCKSTNGYVGFRTCSTEIFLVGVDDGALVKLSTRTGEPGPVWWLD